MYKIVVAAMNDSFDDTSRFNMEYFALTAFIFSRLLAASSI
jgi:hypothetical protein